MKKKYLTYLAVVAGLVLVLYTYLGGFAEVKVSQTASTQVARNNGFWPGGSETGQPGQGKNRL